MKAIALIVLSLALEIGFLLHISLPSAPRPDLEEGQVAGATTELARG